MKRKKILMLIFLSYFGLLQAQKWEYWQDKIPVSGGVRVGLMFYEGHKTLGEVDFTYYVLVPKINKSKTICLEFSSKDGRYSAKRIEKIIPENKVGHHYYWFSLPTEFRKQLKEYSTKHVVILASLKSDCNNTAESYLISRWGAVEQNNWSDPNKSPLKRKLDTLRVVAYVNSQIPIIAKASKLEKSCKELQPPTIAYNKECVMLRDSVNLSKEIVLTQRIRRMGRIKENKYKFLLKKD